MLDGTGVPVSPLPPRLITDPVLRDGEYPVAPGFAATAVTAATCRCAFSQRDGVSYSVPAATVVPHCFIVGHSGRDERLAGRDSWPLERMSDSTVRLLKHTEICQVAQATAAAQSGMFGYLGGAVSLAAELAARVDVDRPVYLVEVDGQITGWFYSYDCRRLRIAICAGAISRERMVAAMVEGIAGCLGSTPETAAPRVLTFTVPADDGDLWAAVGAEIQWSTWLLVGQPRSTAAESSNPSDALEEDYPQVWDLLERAFLEWSQRERIPYAAWLESQHAARRTVLRVVRDDRGNVVAASELQLCATTLVVDRIAVHKPYRGRGLGGLLLRDAGGIAHHNGSQHVAVWADERSGSLSFYRANGMLEVSVVRTVHLSVGTDR